MLVIIEVKQIKPAFNHDKLKSLKLSRKKKFSLSFKNLVSHFQNDVVFVIPLKEISGESSLSEWTSYDIVSAFIETGLMVTQNEFPNNTWHYPLVMPIIHALNRVLRFYDSHLVLQ